MQIRLQPLRRILTDAKLAPSAACTGIGPSPVKSIVKSLATARPTRPAGTVIWPVSDSCGATSTACPPSARVIAPAWLSRAGEAVRAAKSSCSAGAACGFAKSSVLARKPVASTRPPAPIKMPLGLIRNSRPLAVNSPLIREAPLPVTRFTARAEAEGCSKRTVSPE